MPNHCDNELHIYEWGDSPERVDAVLDFIGALQPDPEFSFDKLIPQPADLVDTESGVLRDELYHWRLEHWGTKWGAYDQVYERLDDGHAVLRFNTAWAPPLPVFLALAARFPNVGLCLEYYEKGCEFCGGMRRDSDPEDATIVEWSGPYKGMRGG